MNMKTNIKKMTSPEMDKMDLTSKKLEIQMKRVELRKERIKIDQLISGEEAVKEKKKQILEEISELRYLLSDWMIDEERTILGSEPFIKPVLNGVERQIVLKKLMSLINNI